MSVADEVPTRHTLKAVMDGDERELRVARIGQLRRVVGFDAYAWLLTDPVTAVGASPLADVPGLPFSELPRLIRLKYLTTTNRWTSLDPPVATLRVATGDRREQSLVWRDLQSAHSMGDVASVVFRDGHGSWGFLDLWRAGDDARFTTEDVARLHREVAPLTEMLRLAVASTFVGAAPPLARRGPAVLVLSPSLEVRAQTAETEALLRSLLPTEASRSPIPAAAYNVAAQLLAVEAGVDANPPSARVHLGDGAWVTLRAARVAGDGSTDPDIAVTIEPTSPTERADLFARAHALTTRETELLGHLVDGADTRTVAGRMFLSEHTVQDHLKAIFAKAETHSRRTLLARIAGH